MDFAISVQYKASEIMFKGSWVQHQVAVPVYGDFQEVTL
jgi:hypothetical protein